MDGNKKSTLVRSPFPPFLSFVLDNPLRRLLINRDKFLREAGIREGDYVLEENSLSVIFCANVLEEICKEGELEGTIAELDRVLKKGGIFFIKEHRGGGGGQAVAEAKKMLQGIGYRKVLDKKTFFSYYVKLLK